MFHSFHDVIYILVVQVQTKLPPTRKQFISINYIEMSQKL